MLLILAPEEGTSLKPYTTLYGRIKKVLQKETAVSPIICVEMKSQGRILDIFGVTILV
jgi:hypothetical protein